MGDVDSDNMEAEIQKLEERRDQLIDENADLKSQVRIYHVFMVSNVISFSWTTLGTGDTIVVAMWYAVHG